MLKKILIIVIILIFGMSAIVIKEILNVTSTPKKGNEKIPKAIVVNPCNLLKKSCLFTHPELGEIEISFLNRPIKINKQFKIKLKTLENRVQQYDAWIDFFSADMNMGYNRPKFNSEGIAKVVLPTCTREIMNWQATILIQMKEPSSYMGAQFNFVMETK